MHILYVFVEWVEAKKMWFMTRQDNGNHIQEFFHCGEFPIIFPHAKKDGEKYLHRVTVEYKPEGI